MIEIAHALETTWMGHWEVFLLRSDKPSSDFFSPDVWSGMFLIMIGEKHQDGQILYQLLCGYTVPWFELSETVFSQLSAARQSAANYLRNILKKNS